jgi:hypothetical protein
LGLAWFGFSDLPDFQQHFSYIVAVSFIGVISQSVGGRHGPHRMVVRFMTIYAISAYHH